MGSLNLSAKAEGVASKTKQIPTDSSSPKIPTSDRSPYRPLAPCLVFMLQAVSVYCSPISNQEHLVELEKTNMRGHLSRLIPVTLIACSLPLNAAVLAGWDVDGVTVSDELAPAPYALAPATLANGITATLTLGAGVVPSSDNNRYGYTVTTDQSSLADAILANHFWEIAITVPEDITMNLDSITIHAESSPTGAAYGAWLSSITGYTAGSELASITEDVLGKTGGFDTDESGFGGPIALSGEAFKGISGTTVSFRFYGWGSTSSSGTTYIRNLTGNDLEINGNLVPEPASFALFFTGLFAAAFGRQTLRYREFSRPSRSS